MDIIQAGERSMCKVTFADMAQAGDCGKGPTPERPRAGQFGMYTLVSALLLSPAFLQSYDNFSRPPVNSGKDDSRTAFASPQ